MSPCQRQSVVDRNKRFNTIGGPSYMRHVSSLDWFSATYEALNDDCKWIGHLNRAVSRSRVQGYADTFYAMITRSGLYKHPRTGSFIGLQDLARELACGFILGQRDESIRYGKLTIFASMQDMLIDAQLHRQDYRAHHFIIAMFADWQGLQTASRNAACDVPEYACLLEHWRTPVSRELVPALLAACDRHTQQSRSSDKFGYDFDSNSMRHFPYEILMLFRLREYEGLENPILDHPLMEPPFDRCPDPVPAYTDELIERTYARLREDWPQFDEYIQSVIDNPTTQNLPL